MTAIERTCPDCRGEGKLTGDGGGMDGGGNYHHPPCETCDDDTHVVPAHAYRGAVRALEAVRDYAGRVCDQYETCDHRACQSSHAAWEIANRYLTGGQ